MYLRLPVLAGGEVLKRTYKPPLFYFAVAPNVIYLWGGHDELGHIVAWPNWNATH